MGTLGETIWFSGEFLWVASHMPFLRCTGNMAGVVW